MMKLTKSLAGFCGVAAIALLMTAGSPAFAQDNTVPFQSLKSGATYPVRPDRMLKLEGTASDLQLSANTLKSVDADLSVEGGAPERLTVTVDGDGDRWIVNVRPLKDAGTRAKVKILATANDGTQQTVERSIESATPVGCQAGDICKYFGVDVGALWLPARDELRKVITINIYPGKVGRSPSEDTYSKRLSVAVSYDVGDISGNNQSAIRDNHHYSIGIGYRLNRYFRVGTGLSLYRHADDNDLRRALYLSLSVDLTGFKVIEDLVKIDPN